jgi:archaellin
MSSLASGIIVIASFLLASVIMFGTFLTMSTTQSQSLKDLGNTNKEKIGSSISITSAIVSAASAGVSTDLTLEVDNTGSQSVADFSEMDVIVQYTDSSDNLVQKYLTYSASGYDDNEWTNPITGVTPDTFNPRMWDPDETFTINLRLAPEVKSGTSALVVVITPKAASDQTSISN